MKINWKKIIRISIAVFGTEFKSIKMYIPYDTHMFENPEQYITKKNLDFSSIVAG